MDLILAISVMVFGALLPFAAVLSLAVYIACLHQRYGGPFENPL